MLFRGRRCHFSLAHLFRLFFTASEYIFLFALLCSKCYNVKELIDGISETYEFDMNALEEIVNNDDIQRYVLNEDKSMIKAKWGHSFKVEPDEDKPSEESLRW